MAEVLAALTRVASSLFKKVFKRNSWLFKFVYLNIYPRPDRLTTYNILSAFSLSRQAIAFLQIGANDGVTGDPIHMFVRRDSWSGVLVEPLPHLYERLVKTYADQRGLKFENVAISTTEGIRPFYRIAPGEGVPDWCDVLGSFRREVILSHRTQFPEIEAHLVVDQVHCVTVDRLLEKHRIEKLDVIVIDAEGYDFEILKQVDVARLCPAIVIYEHDHLSGEDQEECARRLRDDGYSLFRDGQNTVAFLPPRLPSAYLSRV